MGLLGNFKSLFKPSKIDVSKRFEILREAIAGTMSSFYMARDRESDKVVGLKVLDREKTLAFEHRFVGLKKPTEGEIGTALQHPRIVRTLEYGLTNAGQQYVVMEFLDGPGLHSLLAVHDASLDGRRVNLLRQAAEALQAVHQAGYIHHDVCPRNFVCSKDLSSLKLIDFGLTIPATPDFKKPGNRTGTPNYMAPEVVRRRPTDERLDIFSYGATAFEVCTFELPWARGTTGQAALSHEEPIDILSLRPHLDPHLAQTINRCLAPDPHERLPSFGKVLESLARVKSENTLAR